MKWQADMAANPLPTHNHPFDNKTFDFSCARLSSFFFRLLLSFGARGATSQCAAHCASAWPTGVFRQLNDFIIHPL